MRHVFLSQINVEETFIMGIVAVTVADGNSAINNLLYFMSY